MASVPQGLLLVFSDPGDQVSENEFHDWYNNEHIPLRLDLPAFRSWTRLKAVRNTSPPWAQIYDLASYKALEEPAYTILAETRSEREKKVMSKLRLLNKRIYELYQGAPIHPSSPSFNEKNPAPFLVLVSTEIKPEGEEEYNRYYDEEHIPLLAKVPGWLRSRRFVLKDWGKSGTVDQDKELPPPKYLTVGECENLDWIDSPEYKQMNATPWREKIQKEIITREMQIYANYKSWPRR